MGLGLEVGILADLREHDPEGFDYYAAKLRSLSQYLESLGLPKYTEPDTGEVWDCEMFGYSGLHRLRRVAAHLDAYDRLPGPGDIDASSDPVLEGYFSDVTGDKGPFLKRLFGRARVSFDRKYDHLIVHSDAEGFYLPVDFVEVLFPPDELEIPGGMVGSVPRLLAECSRIAKVLEIPSHLDTQSEELWEAADSQGEGATLWERYGVESFSCLGLMKACEQSMRTDAAVVFI